VYHSPVGPADTGADAQVTEIVTRRVTLREAAEVLGVSKEAVRKRVIRGTLRSEVGEDGRRYVCLDVGGDEAPTGESSALISEMRGRIEDLRGQLEAERQAHAEARRLLAAALERIPPQIEAPSGPLESPETPSEPSADTAAPEAQTPAEPRPWWRRWFQSR
jgi:hypothetical protein